MKKTNIKIDLLPGYFVREDKTFDLDSALIMSGKIAGICYDKEGFSHLEKEEESKTLKRVNMTLNNKHHSVYDHIMINFNLQNIPKILAMVLNNEHQYTTSEKSLRYTPISSSLTEGISDKEILLYEKWLDIFKKKIKEEYKGVFSDSKIEKLAQENARYLITVFIPTQMIYSTTLRQINYLASFMKEYIEKADKLDYFESRLSTAMKEFISELDRLHVLDKRLMTNDKDRSLSIFNDNIDRLNTYYGDVYMTKYEGSFALYAQAQRHRTISYSMMREEESRRKYYIPDILLNDVDAVHSWLKDMQSVRDYAPQGELVLISETGKYEDFILKCKERLCSAAQKEIMDRTRKTLIVYARVLSYSDNYHKQEIQKYLKGARCTFGYNCTMPCHFEEGIKLTRKI